MLHNPHTFTLKKYIFEMLQENYPKHEQLLSRCMGALTTKEDIEEFATLAAELYEAGFKRCLEQHREKLAEMGVNFTIVPPPEENKGDPIFPSDTQEKSG